jgi:hypothetical protein
MAQRYQNIKNLINEDDRQYISNPGYPDIPETEDDTYLITSEGDRYDLLARSFYGDVGLWWIIASANNSSGDGLAIQPGIQIRIPANKDEVLATYEEFNRVR